MLLNPLHFRHLSPKPGEFVPGISLLVIPQSDAQGCSCCCRRGLLAPADGPSRRSLHRAVSSRGYHAALLRRKGPSAALELMIVTFCSQLLSLATWCWRVGWELHGESDRVAVALPQWATSQAYRHDKTILKRTSRADRLASSHAQLGEGSPGAVPPLSGEIERPGCPITQPRGIPELVRKGGRDNATRLDLHVPRISVRSHSAHDAVPRIWCGEALRPRLSTARDLIGQELPRLPNAVSAVDAPAEWSSSRLPTYPALLNAVGRRIVGYVPSSVVAWMRVPLAHRVCMSIMEIMEGRINVATLLGYCEAVLLHCARCPKLSMSAAVPLSNPFLSVVTEHLAAHSKRTIPGLTQPPCRTPRSSAMPSRGSCPPASP